MLMNRGLNVSSWLGTDIRSPEIDFCSTPNTGHSVVLAGLPLLTRCRQSALSTNTKAQPSLRTLASYWPSVLPDSSSVMRSAKLS